jgi:hypothetical protein
MKIKEYSFSFNQLVELLGGGPLTTISKHLDRSNPNEHGHDATYKYHCPKCGKVYLSVHHYRCTFQIDIDKLEELCPCCTGLLMQLNIGDLS